jgi:hypothetical protein
MRKWMIKATIATLILLSMAGFSYAADTANTHATVNVGSSLGITVDRDYLNFDVNPDGGWYSAREGGVNIYSTSSVPVNILDRSYSNDPYISFQVNGQWLYNYDITVYNYLYPGSSAYFSATASAQPGTPSGAHSSIWTWTAIAS